MASLHAAIGCIAERSSFNAGLILARTLRQRGHRVSFVGMARDEFRRHVQRHGYGFISLQSPALAELAAAAAGATGILATVRAWRRAQEQRFADLERLAGEVQPELAFLDVLAWNPAASLLAARATPTFLFHGGMLSARFSSRYPPVWSSLVPPQPADTGLGWRLRCTAAWGWARAARRRRLMASGRRWLPAVLEAMGDREMRRAAVKHGWRFCWGDWGPQPALPEIVLSHRALDWPQLHTPDRCYLSGGLASRNEFDGGWAAGLDDRRPLVYAVISTMIREADVFEPGGGGLRKSAEAMKRFLDAVVTAVASRRDWQLLLACGPFARTFAPGGEVLSPNVRIVERAPQTEVLRRAAVMITQAGAGAVREAAGFGVPTLLFPLWTDQFGNSARLVHHGMGERLDYHRATPAQVAAAIGRMMEPRVKEAAARVASQCARDAETETERFVEFVRRHSGLEI